MAVGVSATLWWWEPMVPAEVVALLDGAACAW